MTDHSFLNRLHIGSPDACRAAIEIERLTVRLWFWRTLALVLIVVMIGMAWTANAQGVQTPPGQWALPLPSQGKPASTQPMRCTRIGDKQVCQQGDKVTTCYPIGQMLYCKEGY